LAFGVCRSARADDADRFAMLFLHVDDKEHARARRHSEDAEAIGVQSVGADQGKRVGEDGDGFVEGYAVLLAVALGLLRVPFEAHDKCNTFSQLEGRR
jgi:hypothetical protein